MEGTIWTLPVCRILFGTFWTLPVCRLLFYVNYFAAVLCFFFMTDISAERAYEEKGGPPLVRTNLVCFLVQTFKGVKLFLKRIQCSIVFIIYPQYGLYSLCKTLKQLV